MQNRFDLVIRGGTVVTTADVGKYDVGVRDGRIVALAEHLGDAERVVDATGRLVMPGGVDTHCHIEEPPEGGPTISGTFETETASAITGGTTSMVSFAIQEPGRSMRAVIDDYRRRAAASRIDYGFHMIVTRATDELLGELPSLIAEGNRSIKVFTTYEMFRIGDTDIVRLMEVARDNRALMCIHAENDDAIRYTTERLKREGKTAVKYHPASKPIEFEAEAIRRLSTYAEMVAAPAHFFHLSGGAAADEVRRGNQRNPMIFGETCPQYLVFTAEDLDRPGREGEKFVFSPAPRMKHDQEELWRHIRTGTISIISSDHAPFLSIGEDGKPLPGPRPFTSIPNGIPGIGARLPLIFSEGVAKGRISLEKFVAITASNPARLFGLAPRKGSIAIGADADLVVWDPEEVRVVRNSDFNHANDYSPYEGMTVQGWPQMTFVSGELAMKEGKVLRLRGEGRYLPAAPFRMPTLS
ncbi:dihydropyrimidinase [Mesorhizobium delmotii]|uniref:D-hydantoinase n=1 Tax=Mesorhizobium delmotii TaxID=1631247 RepID=A0A2P9ATH0_9HYPH|nr:dihydropyrimidinase [Mesorhizobium delmotii]SJM34459.1 D-hydantoinase [Mesorhizobium delmotii]